MRRQTVRVLQLREYQSDVSELSCCDRAVKPHPLLSSSLSSDAYSCSVFILPAVSRGRRPRHRDSDEPHSSDTASGRPLRTAQCPRVLAYRFNLQAAAWLRQRLTFRGYPGCQNPLLMRAGRKARSSGNCNKGTTSVSKH